VFLYFDTSTLNGIADDSERDEVIARIRRSHVVRISIANILEIVASTNYERRTLLLNIIRQLQNSPPLENPVAILKRQLLAFKDGKKSVNIWILEKENEEVLSIIRHPERVNQEMQQKAISSKAKLEATWKELHKELRPAIQPIIDKSTKPKPKTGNTVELRRTSFLRVFRDNDKFGVESMTTILKATKLDKTLVGRERQILRSSDVWPYIYTAWGIGIYNQSFQLDGHSPKRNAGAIDTNQAVYLALTDVFVTNDLAQRKMLRLVARMGKKSRSVWTYKQLRKAIGLETK
jgi:hypothetical protein